MIVEDLQVHSYERAIKYSGLAKSREPVYNYDRALKLAHAHPGTGHSNFRTGILVDFLVTASHAWWLQAMRYHFFQIVTSTSKMHMLSSSDLNEKEFSCNVLPETIDSIRIIKRRYERGEVTFEQLVESMPIGYQLTAFVTTNFEQLATMYRQRRTHKMGFWRDFLDQVLYSLTYEQQLLITSMV